jgi:ribose-phosphate pyrophosphokinase
MATNETLIDSERVALFALDSSRIYGERVAQRLGIRLAEHEEREFEWGHHKSRPLQSVRGRDVYVVQSLHGDRRYSVNDKLCRLLFFLGALRDASAGRVTAMVPFLCYSRKDRKTKPRDPVTTRYVARLFEAVGVDRLATLEVHNLAAFQNAFRCPAEHLEAHGLIAEFVVGWVGDRALVVSPDVGGIKRATRYRRALERRLGRAVSSAFLYALRNLLSGADGCKIGSRTPNVRHGVGY